MQPNAPGMASVSPPSLQPMASVAPPSSFAGARAGAMTSEPTDAITMPPAAITALPSSRQPQVQSQAQADLGADQAKLRDLQKGPGLNKIGNPFLRGLARVGDIAAPFLLGTGAIAIPGTTPRNLWEQNRQQGRVSADQQALNEQIDNIYKQAQTQNILNPRDKFQPIQTDNGYAAFDPASGTAAPVLDNQGNPLAPPSKPTEPHYVSTPDGTIVALTRDSSTGKIQATEAYKGQPGKKLSVQDLQVGGMPHKVVVDENTGDVVKDLGQSGIKPATVNVNAGLTESDRLGTRLAKPYQTSLDASNAQLEKIADARAMINGNAEAQALGVPKVLTALVSGQGSGVRITQPELNAIARARGIQGDIEGTLNKWAGKGTLTKQQQAQITQILDDVKARIRLKQQIANETLDTINGAEKREDVVAADKAARKRLADLEGGSTGTTTTTGGTATADPLGIR